MIHSLQRFFSTFACLALLYSLIAVISLTLSASSTNAEALPQGTIPTNTSQPPTATNPPTATSTTMSTNTPQPTKTPTPLPPTNTPKPTKTLTPLPPTNTPKVTKTPTPLPPTNTPQATQTATSPIPTDTPHATATPVLPTDTPQATNTPTPLSTDTPTPTLTLTVPPDSTATPTPTATALSVQLTLTKRDLLANDVDENNLISEGDILLYAVILINTGVIPAEDLHLVDTLDPNVTLRVGTVQSDLGTVIQGNTPGDTQVIVALDSLAPGARVTLSFQVSIKPEVNDTQVQNQVMTAFANPNAGSSGQMAVLSDDPDTTEALDVTITPLNGNQPYPNRKLFLPFVAQSK